MYFWEGKEVTARNKRKLLALFDLTTNTHMASSHSLLLLSVPGTPSEPPVSSKRCTQVPAAPKSSMKPPPQGLCQSHSVCGMLEDFTGKLWYPNRDTTPFIPSPSGTKTWTPTPEQITAI